MNRRPTSFLPRFLALVIVLCVCGPATAQAPPVQAAKPFTTPDAQRLTREILPQIEALRALGLKLPLDVSVKTKTELRAYLIERLKKDLPPDLLLASQKGLQMLGLLPKGMNLEAFVIDLLTEQIAGFYDEEAKKLFLMAETPLVLQKACLSHEITHAIQDQQLDLKALGLDRKDNDDYVMAVKSLIEGDAILVMLDYMIQAAATDAQMLADVMRLSENPAMMSADVLASAPAYIKSELLFPYLSGVSFVTLLKTRGGWPLINAAYRHPPLSTEQILHPEKYLDKPDPPVLVSTPDLSKALGPAWKRLAVNVLGEATIRVFCQEFRLETKADQVAQGWGGDQFGVYHCPPPPTGGAEKIAIAWFTTWDSETDAREFYDAYAAAVRQKYPEARPRVAGKTRRAGTRPSGWTAEDQTRPNPALAQPLSPEIAWFTSQDIVALSLREKDVLAIEGCPEESLEATLKEAWNTKKRRAPFTPPALPKTRQPPSGAKPVDDLLKGIGSIPEGLGELLSAILQGQPSRAEIVGNRYRDYTHGFEIETPPRGWGFSRDTPMGMIPVMLTNPQSSASVNVAVFNMSLAPVESWAPILEMMLPGQFQNFKKLSSGPVTVGTLPAYEMSYSGAKEGMNARIRQIILVVGKKTYVITCGALAELYQDCAPDFDTILRSFRILPPETPKGGEPPVPAP